MRDADHLLEWRNDPVTRASCICTDEVPRESHMDWLRRSLASKDRALYIAMLDMSRAGTVRLDYGDRTEISWTVAPAFRGRGIGKAMVSLIVESLTGPIFALIKAENTQSQRIALAAGLALTAANGGILEFTAERPGERRTAAGTESAQAEVFILHKQFHY